jgi:hypothetical protein
VRPQFEFQKKKREEAKKLLTGSKNRCTDNYYLQGVGGQRLFHPLSIPRFQLVFGSPSTSIKQKEVHDENVAF